MSYFHCGNGYPDRCNGYKGPLDASVCTSGRHKYDENGRQVTEPKTALAFCDLCDGTGSFPDADHPCGNCCGLGEVVYIPFPIRRKDG